MRMSMRHARPPRRARGTSSGRGGEPAAANEPSAAIEIDVVDRQRVVRIGGRWLTRVMRAALARQRIERARVCVLLVDDRRMATLHRTWLGLPGPTDVITFDLSGDEPATVAGDIAISAETARRTAREVGWAARHEVAYYAVHGLLHLVGYDDHDPADRRAMRLRERTLLTAAGLPPPPRSRRAAR
jgi:probable rRNA maturation factor